MIEAAQNPDGGWPYVRGSSWTEPTVYAVLALMAEQAAAPRVERALEWLRRFQRSDGGWPPQPSVDQSTWVTALVALLPGGNERAVEWLVRQTGEDSGWVYRLRQRLLGNELADSGRHPGWPWYPGAAGWVAPTALSILALQKAQKSAAVIRRIDEGKKFLLTHVCADGGWNHGSARALGFNANSYPETTGIALLALRGVKSPVIDKAVAKAREHYANCRSAEGLSWLRMGLAAHGEKPAVAPAMPRTVQDHALARLAEAAAAGRNVLLA